MSEGRDWVKEAREKYPVDTAISYPSGVAAKTVRRFINDLADAYERLMILYQATCSAVARERLGTGDDSTRPAGTITPEYLRELATYRDARESTRLVKALNAAASLIEALLQTPPVANSAPTEDYKALYHDLLFCVGNKFLGESRHETAKRYLLSSERHDSAAAAQAENTAASIVEALSVAGKDGKA